MTDLDLSFAVKKEDIEQPVKSGALDLSFVDAPKLTAAQTAEKIVQQRDAGGFPQGREEERSTGQKIKDVFTGNDRETPATQNLPELGSQMSLMEFMGDRADFAGSAALLTTINPVEMVKILSEHAPDMEVRPDEAGNIIVSLEGREAILNKPGVSPFDAMQFGALMATFTPASRAALGASTVTRGALKVGAASGATQALAEGLQGAQGGEFNAGDVAATAALAGSLQYGFQQLAQKIPLLTRKVKESGITDEVRSIYREAAVKLGFSADDVTDDVIRASVDDTVKAITPDEGLALGGEREFKVPLTKGQRTLDDAQLSFEDRARVGLAGEKPQRIVRGFEQEQQAPAINAAKEAVEARLGGVQGAPGATIREGVKAAERQADEVVGQAYDDVGKATLSTNGMKRLLRHVKNSVRGVEFDKTLPQTKSLLDAAGKFQKLIKAFEGKGLKGTDLSRIEQMRRRINTAISAADNPADKAQVTLMKRAFDDYLDEAVRKALFSGDDATLANLKKARGLFSEYAKKFRAQPKRGKSGRIVDQDDPGKFIEKIIDADPTDEQVVNAVFGASNLNKAGGAAMARRFRDILGPDSEGWRAVRSEAVKRLIKTTKINGNDMVSGSKTLTAIDDAMTKNGTLLKELFSKEEISLLRRFAAHVKRTQPDLVRSRENPSGTAQVAGRAVADVVRRLGTLFAAGGEPAFLVTTTGTQAAKSWTQGAKAANAVRPFAQLKEVNPNLVAGAVAASQ